MGAQTDFLSERTREVSAAKPKGAIWQQFLGGTQEERPAVYEECFSTDSSRCR